MVAKGAWTLVARLLLLLAGYWPTRELKALGLSSSTCTRPRVHLGPRVAVRDSCVRPSLAMLGLDLVLGDGDGVIGPGMARGDANGGVVCHLGRDGVMRVLMASLWSGLAGTRWPWCVWAILGSLVLSSLCACRAERGRDLMGEGSLYGEVPPKRPPSRRACTPSPSTGDEATLPQDAR